MVKGASIERGKQTKPNRSQVRSLAWGIKKEFTKLLSPPKISIPSFITQALAIFLKGPLPAKGFLAATGYSKRIISKRHKKSSHVEARPLKLWSIGSGYDLNC